MMPNTLSATPSGTAKTDLTPCKTIVPLAKRGSCCASDVNTDLPRITTSSSTLRETRISPTSPTRSRSRATATRKSSLPSSRIMMRQRSAGTASNTSETICSRVSLRVADASRVIPTLLMSASKSPCFALGVTAVTVDATSSGWVRAPSIASSNPEVVLSPDASAIVASGSEVPELSVIIVAPMPEFNVPSSNTISVSPI